MMTKNLKRIIKGFTQKSKQTRKKNLNNSLKSTVITQAFGLQNGSTKIPLKKLLKLGNTSYIKIY